MVFEQHYSLNPDDYFEHDSTTKEKNALILLEEAHELTGRKGVLLDIGVGRGEMLKAAINSGWEVFGIEPSETFAKFATEKTGIEIGRHTVENCGFERNSFDVVILGAVLEHLYNPDQTVEEISRILRRGGALFVDVHNERGLYFRFGNLYQKLRGRERVVNLAPTFSPFHVFGFTPRSLRRLLRKHGLKPVRRRVYAGQAMVPDRGGVIGFLEQQCAHAVTRMSIGNLGTYIEAWAIKE